MFAPQFALVLGAPVAYERVHVVETASGQRARFGEIEEEDIVRAPQSSRDDKLLPGREQMPADAGPQQDQ